MKDTTLTILSIIALGATFASSIIFRNQFNAGIIVKRVLSNYVMKKP